MKVKVEATPLALKLCQKEEEEVIKIIFLIKILDNSLKQELIVAFVCLKSQIIKFVMQK